MREDDRRFKRFVVRNMWKMKEVDDMEQLECVQLLIVIEFRVSLYYLSTKLLYLILAEVD